MTFVVLGLDALDTRLVEAFGCETLELQRFGTIETFSHNFPYPYTLEIWPTVATGLHPSDHGVGATKGSNTEWNNSVLEAASRVTAHFPTDVRNYLGNMAESVADAENTIAETSEPTVFDGEHRFVHNWPGVTNGRALLDIWDITKPSEDISIESFECEVLSKSAQKFAWIEEMLAHDAALLGAHIHTLDVTGHAYSTETHRDRLREMYEWVEAWIDRLLDQMEPEDELLILGDHGMHVEWLDGAEKASSHSWYPMAATTVDEPLFENMFGAREWIESHVPDVFVDEKHLDLPTEQLKKLGYIR